MYLFTEITTFGPKKTYRVSIGPNENVPYLASSFSNYNDVIIAEKQIEAVVNSFISNTSTTDYDKIKIAHDSIIENIEYDSTISKDDIYNIYGALINKEAVCEGYAKSFKYIMDKLGVPCIIACGLGQNSKGQTENHAWNYVYLDDNWYAIDTTWDDPVIIGYGNITAEIKHSYFLKGSSEFFKDHFENGTLVGTYIFTYPTLSVSNYY
jgi:transglutaminase/protease-like cytokinesis protein 3